MSTHCSLPSPCCAARAEVTSSSSAQTMAPASSLTAPSVMACSPEPSIGRRSSLKTTGAGGGHGVSAYDALFAPGKFERSLDVVDTLRPIAERIGVSLAHAGVGIASERCHRSDRGITLPGACAGQFRRWIGRVVAGRSRRDREGSHLSRRVVLEAKEL